MDLDNLSGYGSDELKGALEQIFEAYVQKIYDRGFSKGQDAPLVWRNKLIPFTTIDGKDYVALDWLMAEIKSSDPTKKEQ